MAPTGLTALLKSPKGHRCEQSDWMEARPKSCIEALSEAGETDYSTATMTLFVDTRENAVLDRSLKRRICGFKEAVIS